MKVAKSRYGRFPLRTETLGRSPTSRAAWKSSPSHRTETASPPYRPSTPTRRGDEGSVLPRVRVVRRVRYRHDYRGYTGDAFRQMFVVDMESGRARQVTDGEGDNWSPVWSPDGRSLAFISDDIEGRDFTHAHAGQGRHPTRRRARLVV